MIQVKLLSNSELLLAKKILDTRLSLLKGDVGGHEFHGNQYTGGTGGLSDVAAIRQRIESGKAPLGKLSSDIGYKGWILPDGTFLSSNGNTHAELIRQFTGPKGYVDAVNEATAAGWIRVQSPTDYTIGQLSGKSFDALQNELTHGGWQSIAFDHLDNGKVRSGIITQTDFRNNGFDLAETIKYELRANPRYVYGEATADLVKGDIAGHDFHGNQYTGGEGGGNYAENQRQLEDSRMLASKLRTEGGFTHPEPTTGYVVANAPEKGEIVNGEATPREIRDYMQKNPGSIGGWFHEGKTYLDTVSVIHNRKEAISLGQKTNQISIWDVAKKEEIKLLSAASNVTELVVHNMLDATLNQNNQNQLGLAVEPDIAKYAPEDFTADWDAEPDCCPGCQDAEDASPYDNPYDVPDPTEVCFSMNGVGKNESICLCQIIINNDDQIDAVDFDPTAYDVDKSALVKGDVGGHEFHGNQWTQGGLLDHMKEIHGFGEGKRPASLKTLIAYHNRSHRLGLSDHKTHTPKSAMTKGGVGSGDHGHEGRPGERGGSGVGGGRMGAAQRRTAKENAEQRGVSPRIAERQRQTGFVPKPAKASDKLGPKERVEVTDGHGGTRFYEMQPSTNIHSVNAWISPKGEFYPVYVDEHGKPSMEMDHTTVAEYLGDKTGGTLLDEAGWIHMSDSIGVQFNADRSPTEAQAKLMGRFFDEWDQIKQNALGTNADKKDYYENWMNIEGNLKVASLAKGGTGSGNYGHAGRAGEVGGSGEGGGAAIAMMGRMGRQTNVTLTNEPGWFTGPTIKLTNDTRVGKPYVQPPVSDKARAAIEKNLSAHGLTTAALQANAQAAYNDGLSRMQTDPNVVALGLTSAQTANWYGYEHDSALEFVDHNMSPYVAASLVAATTSKAQWSMQTGEGSVYGKGYTVYPNLTAAATCAAFGIENPEIEISQRDAEEINKYLGKTSLPIDTYAGVKNADGFTRELTPGTYRANDLSDVQLGKYLDMSNNALLPGVPVGLPDGLTRGLMIGRGADPSTVLTGMKQSSFTSNIAFPEKDTTTTNDTHVGAEVLKGAKNSDGSVMNNDQLAAYVQSFYALQNGAGYTAITEAIMKNAKSTGVIGSQYQAVMWVGDPTVAAESTKAAKLDLIEPEDGPPSGPALEARIVHAAQKCVIKKKSVTVQTDVDLAKRANLDVPRPAPELVADEVVKSIFEKLAPGQQFHYELKLWPLTKLIPTEARAKKYIAPELVTALKNGEAMMPGIATEQGFILDGHHRFYAAEDAGRTGIWMCTVVKSKATPERLAVKAEARLKLDTSVKTVDLVKGDTPGHDFHGNQYTGGEGGNPEAGAEAKTKEIVDANRAKMQRVYDLAPKMLRPLNKEHPGAPSYGKGHHGNRYACKVCGEKFGEYIDPRAGGNGTMRHIMNHANSNIFDKATYERTPREQGGKPLDYHGGRKIKAAEVTKDFTTGTGAPFEVPATGLQDYNLGPNVAGAPPAKKPKKKKRKPDLVKGDTPGHEFRGNQWSSMSAGEKRQHLREDHQLKDVKSNINGKHYGAHLEGRGRLHYHPGGVNKILVKGDVGGHEFHGNQYTGGLGSAIDESANDPTAINSLKAYTGQDYSIINSVLRENSGYLDPTIAAQGRDEGKEIDKLMARSTMTETQTVYRGMGPQMFQSLMATNTGHEFSDAEWKSLSGKTFHDQGFVSTTKSLNEARGWDFKGAVAKITVPAGTHAIDIDAALHGQQFEQSASEHEVLLNRGLTYRVTKVASIAQPHEGLGAPIFRKPLIYMEVVNG